MAHSRLIRVSTNDPISLLLMAEKYSIVEPTCGAGIGLDAAAEDGLLDTGRWGGEKRREIGVDVHAYIHYPM